MTEEQSTLCIYHILFTHSPTDGYLGCFYLLVTVSKAALNMVCRYLFKPLLSILLDTDLGVEIPVDLVVLGLISSEINKLFSIVTISFYIPTRNT